ncbi:glycoside hydrolase family 97 protein [Arenibacter algicola]|uniref:glycoside hydrolase family 97 protein n=1 Tax=Arenibacter algicola TaxID=616991 RepID=UPI001C07D61B|nr:glycoside hydrolase family 97 protein [Arenibacter algicola]MBU2905132.1 glycoside hydrolase family 97 protein [Arenibacter algicola]
MIVRRIFFIIALLTGLVSCQKSLDNFNLTSPDGNIDLRISLIDSTLTYQLNWSGKEILGISELEIFTESAVTVLDSRIVEHDSTWTTAWGQQSSIRDHYKELQLDLNIDGVGGKMLARAYNEGVAFRFVLADGPKPKEAVLSCSYALPDGSAFFAPRGEHEPMGPLSLKDLNTYHSGEMDKGLKTTISVPLLVETPDHLYIALLESDLYAANGFKSMNLGVNLEAGNVESINKVELSEEGLTTPWRLILLGKSAGDLVVNTTAINLATPCQLENTDWIRPGKCLWDFRVNGYTAPDGFVYGINTESYLRFIDYAAATSIEYFMIDGGWYSGHSDGEFKVKEDLDIARVMDYAKEKKVDVILYYDRKRGDFGDTQLYPYFQSLGAKGIKYGFMGDNPDFSRGAIKKSAESELLIDFHDGPVPFTGIHRTFPNAVTREYCHAQQDSRRAFTPESFIKMALINAITGPLDMNNGNFDITGINSGLRHKSPLETNTYYSTVASEAARTLVIFSGLVCIPDAPEAYESKKDLFEFIQKQPVGKWNETRILHSKIGEYITTARRHGKDWFIGSVYNQQGGELDIELNFLDAGTEYKVTYYEDAPETHCKTNPEAYQVRNGKVKKDDVIRAIMAPGGGHCIWIRPVWSE